MLKITLRVPVERDRSGFVEISDGLKTLIEDVAVASADAKLAKQTGNSNRDPLRAGGHPPFGRYELTARGATPSGAEAEYGNELLLFEPVSGPALDAESYGRLALLVYAGAPGRDMNPRRTQGGVRLSRRAMSALLERLGNEEDVELNIEALAPPRWWAFWRKSAAPSPLSKDPPRFSAPPLDEASLAAVLLRSAVRRSRTRRSADDDRFLDRNSSSSSSSQSSADYRGGGGSGGGGGASGAWTDAPAAGRGPGVNAAGMIVGAAGVAALAAAAAADRDTQSSGSGGETAPGDTASETQSSGSDSGSSSTQTNTSY